MEGILYVKDLYELITNENIPTYAMAKKWAVLNCNVIGAIRQFVHLSEHKKLLIRQILINFEARHYI